MICNKTLRECLEFYSKDTLVYIMKDKGLLPNRAMRKRDMCQILVEHMMQPEELEQYFSCLFDDEIARLEYGIREDLENHTSEGSYIIPMLLCQAEYAFRFEFEEDPELFWLPYDVAEAYLQIQSDSFTEKRKERTYFLSCLMAVGAFYGQVPLRVIAPLMKKTEKEVMEAVSSLPRELNYYIVVDEILYHQDLYIEDYGLLCEQKDVPFYMPDEEELDEMGRFGYLPTRAEMRALVNHLIMELGMEIESAEYVSMWIQKMTAASGSIEDIIEYLEDFGALERGDTTQELLDLLEAFQRNTRKLCNRGFTDMELSNCDPATILKLSQPIILGIPETEPSKSPMLPFQ